MRKADSSGLIVSSSVDGEDGASDDGSSEGEDAGRLEASRVDCSCSAGAESEFGLVEVQSQPIFERYQGSRVEGMRCGRGRNARTL